MLSRTVNGFTEAQVIAALEGFYKPPRFRTRVELYDNKDNLIREITNLILEGSEVQHVAEALIQTTARLVMREAQLDLEGYADMVIADGPLFYWRLGESSGTVAADASGNGRTGTYAGSPTLSTASLLPGATENNAVTFDGTNDRVTVADAAWMDVSILSVEAWIKTTATAAYRNIISRDDSGSNKMWQFRVTSSNYLELVLWVTGPTAAVFTTAAIMTDGIAHHCVATYDGVAVEIYVDGIRVLRTAETRTLLTGTRLIEVGSIAESAQFFSGTIDEVAMYGRALSAAEIRNHYQKGADKLNELLYFTDRLKIYTAIEMLTNGSDGTAWAEWPVGYFLLQNPHRKATPGGVVVEMDGYDQNVILDNTRVTARYLVASGTNYITAVTTALQAAGLTTTSYQLTATSLTLPAAKEWETGTSYLQIVNDLLYAINYRPFRFNGAGIGIAEPYELPHTRSDEFTYETNSGGVMLEDVDQELKLIGVPNRVTLTRATPDATTIVSTVNNTSLTSPANQTNSGINQHIQEVPAADQSTLTALAQRELTERTEAMQISFRTPSAPFHDNVDRIRFIHNAGQASLSLDDSFIEQEWRLPLNETGDMEHRCKQVVRVV